MARDILAEAERAAQDIVASAVKIKAEADRALASAIAMTFAAGESRANASVTWSRDRRSALGASVSRWSGSRVESRRDGV
jgi:hypothetical protein